MRAEQDAGLTILQLPLRPTRSCRASLTGRLLTLVPLSLVTWLIASYLIVQASAPGGAGTWILSYAFPVMLAVITTGGLPTLLWQNRIRFCEYGVLWDRTMHPWSELLEYKWTHHGGKLELHSVDAPNNRPWVTLTVAINRRAALQELMDAKLAATPKLPVDARRVGIGQVPLHTVFLKPHLRKHLLAIALSLTCGLALAYLVWGRGSGTREFDDACLIAMYLWVFTNSWKLRWFVRNPGAPRARVFARRDLLGLAAIVATALVIYYATTRYMWPFSWLGYAAGLAFVYLTLSTLTYFFITQLDLREEGVVMPGDFSLAVESRKSGPMEP